MQGGIRPDVCLPDHRSRSSRYIRHRAPAVATAAHHELSIHRLSSGKDGGRTFRCSTRGPLGGALWGFISASTSFLPACSTGQVQSQSMKVETAPVTVATAIQKTVPVELRAIGNVEAYSQVSVKSQVEGQLGRVYFREGDDVKQGDLLFTINRRPF